MYICLFIAIFSTLCWLNVTIAEIITARVNPYATDNSIDKKRALIKNALSLIMSITWTVFISLIK